MDIYLDDCSQENYDIMFSHSGLKGWIEPDGKQLSECDIKTI